MAKRVIDLVLSLAALPILAPLMLAIALAVRLDSPGPILFCQARVGKNRRCGGDGRQPGGIDRRKRRGFGREFCMYKFRTLREDAPKYAVCPTDNADPRITRVGRFLRKTSLDELPQLINVLKGDMSLVGPRPEMRFIVEGYEPVHLERLEMKPGITGPWQLRGPRDRAIHEAIGWDLHYVKNWSLRRDFLLLVETFGFVLRARNR